MKRFRRSGVTLPELIVVLTILGILAAVGIPGAYCGSRDYSCGRRTAPYDKRPHIRGGNYGVCQGASAASDLERKRAEAGKAGNQHAGGAAENRL